MALELVVVTPEGEALSEEVEQVVLPGEAGDFGVLESHERFLTPLQLGPMEIIRSAADASRSADGSRSGDASRPKQEWAAITSGFAEVDGSRVVVLVDSCALARDIDRDETENRRVAAEGELANLAVGDATAGERARLTAVVARAELELEVADR
jgi:F-type H+-transporting ATPase subunit epsilon